MYKYYSCLGFLPLKHDEEGKYIHKEEFNNLPHLIKNSLHVNCMHDGFVIYNDYVLIQKWESIEIIPDYMVPVDFCHNN